MAWRSNIFKIFIQQAGKYFSAAKMLILVSATDTMYDFHNSTNIFCKTISFAILHPKVTLN